MPHHARTAALILLLAAGAAAAQPQVELLPDGFAIPRAVRDDGNLVVGQCDYCTLQMFRWTHDGGMQSLGCPTEPAPIFNGNCSGTTPGHGVVTMSAGGIGGGAGGGSTVIATISQIGMVSSRACRWTFGPGAGPATLIDATLTDGAGAVGSTATGVSADGSVICGDLLAAAHRAFRWTAATGARDITPPEYRDCSANGISPDGRTITGIAYPQVGYGYRPFRWTTTGGWRDLGSTPGIREGGGLAVSRDGAVVVGSAINQNGITQIFRWTAATGLVSIGTLPGDTGAYFKGMTSDGNAIVADTYSSLTSFLWTRDGGAISLEDFLLARGVSIPGAFALRVGPISPSGTALIVNGYRGTGYDATVPRSWVIRGLPALTGPGPLCPADIDGSGDLSPMDIFTFITAWFDADPRADFDRSDTDDVSDIFAFLNAWLAGC